MRLAIDATGKTRQHVNTRRRQSVAEQSRSCAPTNGCVARADDRHATSGEQPKVATSEEHRRRQRIVEQSSRVPRMPHHQYL